MIPRAGKIYFWDKKLLGTFGQNRDQIGATKPNFPENPKNRDRIVSTASVCPLQYLKNM